MTEKRELRKGNSVKAPKYGYIEVDEDLNIDWELDRDHEYYPELRKAVHAVDNGHAQIKPKHTKVAFSDDGEFIGHGHVNYEPNAEDIIRTVERVFRKEIDSMPAYLAFYNPAND
jgi:hypothetical protein